MKNALFSWTLPTERQEGGPLPVSEIAHVQIEVSANGGTDWTDLGNIPPDTLTLQMNDLIVAAWLVRGTVEDTQGRRSIPIETAFDVLDDSPPASIIVDVALS